ncbi:J domain-containing protein [candidate division WOR-3 bacterium]|nr:J domain-containing protein [candidate division WOR-3 bacterium]
MEYRDYYQVLGVTKDADEKAIKAAYRKLARKYHPDVAENKAEAGTKFKEINEAYEVLSNPDKRSKYDQLGADWQQYQQTGGRGGFDWTRYQSGQGQRYAQYSGEDLQDLFGGGQGFSDFFSFVFGGQRQPQESRVGGQSRDIEQPVLVTLAEAYAGAARRLKRQGGPTIEVKIPAGVETGARIRVKGQGMAGRRGRAGDLWLVVEVEPDSRFTRTGDDLRTRVQVPLYTAILGGEVTVPLIQGRAKLRVPPETQSGTEMRLRGQGMPRLNSTGRGDLFVTVEIRLPSRLTEKELSLFRELARMRPSGL